MLNKHNSTIDLIIKKFCKTTNLKIEKLKKQVAKKNRADAIIKLQYENKFHEFTVEYKNNLQVDSLGTIIHYLKQLSGNVVLFAPYINSATAEKLRESNVSFLDLAGNAYINKPPIFIDRQGKRLEQYKVESSTAMFKPAGLKVVFTFLCDPVFINLPQRKIAQMAGVSLGMVSRVLDSMKQAGFLLRKDKKTKILIEKEKLLERWVIYYQNILRPKLLIRKYTTDNSQWWQSVPLDNQQALWGGEVAASMMTKYLKPMTSTIYMYDTIGLFVVSNKLKESKEGKIEILKAFWGKELIGKENQTVPPILVYADLLAQTNSRSHETAKIIYEEKLAKYLK